MNAPLVAGHAPTSILTWVEGRPVTAAQFCAEVREMAAALPSSRHVLNFCEDGPRFMLATAAAWLRGQAILLPPDRLVRSVLRLQRDFPDAYALCDTPEAERMARDCGLSIARVDFAGDAGEAWPPPELPLDLEVACLHTSGSTGEPSRHRKYWREFTGGAGALSHALGPLPADGVVIGTVAPQHMYGLETTIVFPLLCGARLLPTRPALPGDIAGAMKMARSLGVHRAWLFTTPLQLRAFVAAGEVKGLARVFSATMPIDIALARQVEQDWDARIEEIYGCTEGGTLASRRPTEEDFFTAFDGVEFTIDERGRALALCTYLPAPVPLGDRIELLDAPTTSKRIRLLGREDDLVKIGGKRASLAGLTATLKAVPGVVDGAIFFPADDAKRLCAMVVAPGLSPADLQRALAALIDPAFLPRPLVFVDAIPRNATSKASLPMLRELAVSHGRLRPEAAPICVTASFASSDPVFAGHFPGRPVVPGVLLIERVEAALAANGRRVAELTAVKFHTPAAPGERLDFRIVCTSEGEARFEVECGTTRIASGACKVVPIE